MALGNRGSFAGSEMPEGEAGGKKVRPGKANNTSRSLQIISEQQGWDATRFIGEVYQSREVDRSDTGYGFEAGTNSELDGMDISAGEKPTFRTPDHKPRRTPKGGSPFPGGGW